MTIEEQLKELMIKKSGSVNKFSQSCGLSTSTVATMFTRGVNKTNVNTIIKICQALSISADELSNGRITFTKDIEQPNELNVLIEKLSPQGKEKLKEYVDFLIQIDNKEGKE